jgi:ABC-2 type transport system ATP-binding protein
MSIRVKNITKKYGKQKALDNVSFEINTGEIVGLLGPNGAGKTTMMKILTCFIPPTSGDAWVCDFDVQEQSLQVRRKVGYLPESNPQYLDMYVKEYLMFVAGIYKIRNRSKRVAEMISITGIDIEQNKKIGALSKGYRQRVGLAQALIHDPEVLILDEPTSGLDPNQLVDIRNLIKKIGTQKTVILSTHIMQEVEALCSRAIFINKGVIVADDKTANLSKIPGSRNIVIVEFDKNVDENSLSEIAGITRFSRLKDNLYELESQSGEDFRSVIFHFAVEKGLTVLSLKKKESQSIQEVFQQLTRKSDV